MLSPRYQGFVEHEGFRRNMGAKFPDVEMMVPNYRESMEL